MRHHAADTTGKTPHAHINVSRCITSTHLTIPEHITVPRASLQQTRIRQIGGSLRASTHLDRLDEGTRAHVIHAWLNVLLVMLPCVRTCALRRCPRGLLSLHCGNPRRQAFSVGQTSRNCCRVSFGFAWSVFDASNLPFGREIESGATVPLQRLHTLEAVGGYQGEPERVFRSCSSESFFTAAAPVRCD